MSKTIDSKVVEMRFDNKHFESNVQTSLSTLEKLKQKLNLSGATKGLENVNAAAKKVDMTSLGAGVEAVQAKFSVLQVIGVTALANITNSAVNAGKNIVSALTIDPIKTGLSEYETKINAIQVIQSNTRSHYTAEEIANGKQMDDITSALDELNTYADKTIYNYAQMTDNVGKFVAQGLTTAGATNAVKGMANLAAASGASAQDMARATYQISQSLSSSIKLMDWNSLRNANMATVDLKNTLIDLAKVNGVAIDDMIAKHGSFEQTLSEGWLTGEMFTEAMNIYSGLYSEAELKAKGFTDAQIENFMSLAKSAESAATEVKTFTQLWDVLKETAQSGWTQTWELIIGDFDEAKKTLTALQVYFSEIINRWSDARNFLVGGVMDFGSLWGNIEEKLGIDKLKKIGDVAKTVSHDLEHFQDIVTKVWRGDYNNRGDNPDRFDLLTQAGYDPRVVQDLANKGYGYELTMEDVEASHKKFGLTMASTTESTKQTAKAITNLTDEELENAGLTKDEIELFRALAKESERTGESISDIAKRMSENDGRSLLIDSFKNIGNAISGVVTVVKEAWQEILDPPTKSDMIIKLYNMIDAFNKFTEKLRYTNEEGEVINDNFDKIKRTFKGVFALVDILATVIGGPLKIAFEIVKQLLGVFDLNILDVTAAIGDAIVKFRDWIDSTLDFTKVFEKMQPYIEGAVTAIREWVDGLKNSENPMKYILDSIVSGIRNSGGAIRSALEWLGNLILDKLHSIPGVGEWLDSLKDSENIPRDIIMGLANGIRENLPLVWDAALEIGQAVLDSIKDLLGIHSPSTETKELGKNTVEGFVEGLKEVGGSIATTLKDLLMNALEYIRNLDFGSLLSTVLTFAMSTGILKFINNLSSMFGGVGDILDETAGVVKTFNKKVVKHIGSVVKNFGKLLKGISFNQRTEGIKNIAISLLMLVGAIAILTMLDMDKVQKAVDIIAQLAIILVALSAFTAMMSKSSTDISKDGVKIEGFKTSILGVAAAMLLVAAAIKIVGSMDAEEVKRGFLALAGILIVLGGVLIAFGYLAKGKGAQNIDKVGKTMFKLAAAMLILSLVAKILATMEWSEMGKAGVGLLGLVGIITLLVLVTKIAGKNIDKVGPTILKLSIAMMLLALVAKSIARMEWSEMAKAGVGLLGLVGIVALLVLVTKLAGGKLLGDIGSTLLMISGAMLILSFTAKIIATMEWGEMGRAAVGLVGLVAIIALLVLVVKMAGKDAPKIGLTLLALSGAIAILAIVAVLLGLVDVETLKKGVIAIGILGVIMALMIAATKGASDCKGNLIVMTVAIAVMAAAIAALSFIEPNRLGAASIALGLVMAMFALIVKAGSNVKSSMGVLIVMTVAVGVLAGILYLLAQLPVESTLGAAVTLSVLLLAVSAALLIISHVGKSAGNALAGVILLLAIAVPLLAFVGILALMQNIENATKNSLILVALAAALTLLLIPLTLVGALATTALIGIAALTLMAIPLVAFVGVLALMENLQNAEKNVNALIRLMTTMTILLTAIGILSPFIAVGLVVLTAMATLMLAMGALAVAIGALMTEFPQLEDFLNKGIPVMEQLAHGIGSMIGNFIAGFTEAVFSTLPKLGECLSQFMAHALVFIAGAKMVDEKVLAGVGILTASIIALTVADLINGVASFLTMGSSFADLGTELSQFMTNAMPFILGASLLNADMMNGVKALAETVLILTAVDVINGLTSWLTGGSSLADFGSQLSGLGTNLKDFVTNLGTFDEAQVKTVRCASNAIKIMANAANEIPNEGGVWAKLFGDNSIATFGSYLPDLGTNLAAFATNLGTFDEDTANTVTCAANAIKAIAEAGKDIPNEGGVWAKLFGDNSIATFGSYLPDLGTNLAAFATNLGTFSEDTVTTVGCAANAIKSMAEAASEIPNEGGWAAKLFGDNSLATFGGQLAGLGENLAAFVKNLGTFTTEQVASVRSAVSAIKAFADLGDINLGSMVDYLPSFGSVMVDFGDYMYDFLASVATIATDTISTAITNMNKVVDLANSISGVDSDAVSSFGAALKKLGKSSIDDFITEFTSTTSFNKAKTAGKDLLDEVISGIEAKEKAIKTAGESAAEQAVDGMDNFANEAESAGKDLGKGLVKGIEAKEQAAYDAGFALGQAAVQGEKDGQASNSPSKLTILAGKWLGEGLVIGMGNMTRSVYNAGHDLGGTATDSISSTISKIADAVNTDLDVNPTIRPVLDLSDVESNAGLIGAMIGSDSLVGVSANVKAISATMNRRGQNGTNADVVTEIRKLRKGLDNVGNNVTNINGITYDDGSNVSDAVKVLVRAAKVERRR